MSEFIIGLDLGQSQDYTALAVLERIEPAPPPRPRVVHLKSDPVVAPTVPTEPVRFECSHLERLPLGTLYPQIIAHVQELLRTPRLRGQTTLVVDATGVGRPVVDSFTAAGVENVAVTITGGDSVNREGGMVRVPKKILVSTLQVLFQSERLKVGPNALRDVLVREMMNFQVTITEAANATYAGRTGSHDDLVLAVALAAWQGNQPKQEPIQESTSERYMWGHRIR